MERNVLYIVLLLYGFMYFGVLVGKIEIIILLHEYSGMEL